MCLTVGQSCGSVANRFDQACEDKADVPPPNMLEATLIKFKVSDRLDQACILNLYFDYDHS